MRAKLDSFFSSMDKDNVVCWMGTNKNAVSDVEVVPFPLGKWW